MRRFLTLCVVILAGVAGFLLWQKNAMIIEVPDQESITPTATPIGNTYKWTFVYSEADDKEIPHTKVTLNYRGESHSLGNYEGSCKEVLVNELGIFEEKADPGEIARIQCWFAGSGDEIGVFQEGQSIVVKAGELGEAGSNGESFRGNFETILSL